MKKILTAIALFAAGSMIFAYNPPVSGEDLGRLADPIALTSAASASGGALTQVVPASILYNPALPYLVQRTTVDLSYTGMIDTNNKNTTNVKYGQAFQMGTIIPTKLFVYTGMLQGSFVYFPEMNTGSSIVIHGSASKDITDKLYVGANLYTGFYFASGSDFTIGVDLGMLYDLGKLSFLKDCRLGISLLNLGKPLTGNYKCIGLNGAEGEGFAISYPGICTPRVSFGATLFDVKKFKGGFSADLSFPFFQNAVFDCGLGFTFADIVNLSCSWQANLRELIKGAQFNMPSVGVGVKFSFTSAKISAANEDWAKSDMTTTAAWQQVYGGVQVISAGAVMSLGQQDTSAPEIILWFGDEGEEE